MYRGPYHLDPESSVVRGNPALSAMVQDTRHALVNKGRSEGAGSRDHAEAMRVEDLRQAFERSMRECPEVRADEEITNLDDLLFVARHLLLRGSSSLAFVIWTRYDVTCIDCRRVLTLASIESASCFRFRESITGKDLRHRPMTLGLIRSSVSFEKAGQGRRVEPMP